MTLWQRPAVKAVIERAAAVQKRLFAQRIELVSRYALPLNPDVEARPASSISFGQENESLGDLPYLVAGAHSDQVGELIHNVTMGRLLVRREGIAFLGQGTIVGAAVVTGTAVLQIDTPEDDSEPRDPMRTPWNNVEPVGAFAFDYLELVEAAYLRAHKPAWLRFLPPFPFIRLTVESSSGQRQAFSFGLMRPDLPETFLQLRLRREIDYFVETEFVRYAPWQPIVAQVWADRPNRPKDTGPGTAADWQQIHDEARAKGFDDAAAVAHALESLSPRLALYRQQPALGAVIAEFEMIAKKAKPYRYDGRPVVIRDAWMIDPARVPRE
jgi:hypothetical protein